MEGGRGFWVFTMCFGFDGEGLPVLGADAKVRGRLRIG